MSSTPKVCADIESYCTACRLMTWHVVVAMVGQKPAKVECHRCHKQHAFRAGPPGEPKPRAAGGSRKAAAGPKPDPRPSQLDERLSAGASLARTYTPRDRFVVDEVIQHPTFGTGLVTALPAATKMEVHFREGKKLLACGMT